MRRFGLHPVFGIDGFEARQFAPDDWLHRQGPIRTDAEDAALLHDLLAGVELKTRLSLELLRKDDWDLLVSVFGESHAGGHHLWHRHDAAHPRFDPSWVERNGDAIRRLYGQLDASLADHLEALGPTATTIVVLSHGMAPHFDATHLLEEILLRLDDHELGVRRAPYRPGWPSGCGRRCPPVRATRRCRCRQPLADGTPAVEASRRHGMTSARKNVPPSTTSRSRTTASTEGSGSTCPVVSRSGRSHPTGSTKCAPNSRPTCSIS